MMTEASTSRVRQHEPNPLPLQLLNDGNRLPTLAWGLGSVNRIKERKSDAETNVALVQLIIRAIQEGYTHIDASESYQNERELGEAIRECGVPREKLYITTKIAGTKHQVVADAVDASLARMGLDYVDLYLIQSPWQAGSSRHLQRLWKEMEDAKAAGKARSIGVANFDRSNLESILKKARIPPAVNQFECHPYCQQRSLIDFCVRSRITPSAYSTLIPLTQARGGPVDACLTILGFKYGASETEVGLRWAMDQGMAVVTTSRNPQRMQSVRNNVFKFRLSESDVDEISSLGKGKQFSGDYDNLYFKG